MKTVRLQKITQYERTCYIGKMDPRDLIRVANDIGMGDLQDAQRPLSKKKVTDISKYVAENQGLLPNTITIATTDNRLSVQADPKCKDSYCMNFPETDEEYANFANAIEVMDGQHRLYSFREDLRKIKDYTPYEIGFVMYIMPTLTERRTIFVTCNEKQDKVDSNLLMWFRNELHLLSNEDKAYQSLVTQLNCTYPLANRIIMSAEKIKKGFKAQQVIDVLKKAHVNDLTMSGSPLNENEKVKVISRYLCAWEEVCGFEFSKPDTKNGAAVKIAGLRFMMLLLKPFWDRCIQNHTKFDKEYIKSTIMQLISSYGVEYDQFFTTEEHVLWFRDRTAITAAANRAEDKIKHFGSESFNPLD